MIYTLPPLTYNFGALEPYIDAQTMEIHHDRHHQTYINNLNNTLVDHLGLQNKPLADILREINLVPEAIRTAVRNNGGGTYNHNMFWTIMSPNGGGMPKGRAGKAIIERFGSFEAFQTLFNNAAKSVFGSGWAWLVIDKEGKLQITVTGNQDCPLMFGQNPILGLDVWEHAYYLQYQNKRPDYINAWWHVVNWEEVEANYHQVLG
jgi:Fe-Mn family superoxide dismutase